MGRPASQPAKGGTGGPTTKLRRRRTPERPYEARRSSGNAARKFSWRLAAPTPAGCGGKCAIPRAVQRRPGPVESENRLSWPLQQEHFRRKSRPERHQQAIASGFHLALGEPLLKDEQHARACFFFFQAEDVIRDFRIGTGEAQLLLHEREQLLSAGVQY